jgi:hypothetical protein
LAGVNAFEEQDRQDAARRENGRRKRRLRVAVTFSLWAVAGMFYVWTGEFSALVVAGVVQALVIIGFGITGAVVALRDRRHGVST